MKAKERRAQEFKRMSLPLLDYDYGYDLTKIKTTQLTSTRTISIILNIILSIAICLFSFSLIHFLTIRDNRPKPQEPKLLIVKPSHKPADLSTTRCYYDYDCYSNNMTLHQRNKTRRFFYIDLGCFDGRDINLFLHFHQNHIAKLGKLFIIAFEPDPINFSVCKSTQDRHPSLGGVTNNLAAWIENGQVRYATEKGQKSKIDQNSALFVPSVDFSEWLKINVHADDYVYIKFTVESVEIPILEKLVHDKTLALIDHMEIEWHDELSSDLEPRRISLECMFDNFGMDFLYMINPADLIHAYNMNETFNTVPKDRGWKLKDSLVRFYYTARKEVPELISEGRKPKDKNLFY
ncbi:unnamed protein product [Rotaria magnacalcarata]|uniref:Methyltransferase FkbM domain-containing protein n=2 Tax=Rotaria magnacalcarata TaxID=392030 RepID=A0A816Z2P5_9BILA|nr:unnamed protein product [Rotaria magnacalcarata]CAF2046475.1 unnamed protein product [Rotaria magnacalcarata]CAF2072600.1 unnamed protein product [Rotaria magnacalcarata]CAF2191143.1 unnamed protein product [Rotaria magnacalcarata]